MISNQPLSLKEIGGQASVAGFSAWGACAIKPINQFGNILKQWIEKGYHAGMSYMERSPDLRANPSLVMPEARSAIVLLDAYFHPENDPGNNPYKISRFAQGRDYHKVVRNKLKILSAALHKNNDRHSYRLFCDSSPLPEKELAVEAGLGWIGKNHLLIHPVLGSWCFIGIILTTRETETSIRQAGNCGSCHLCIDACPAQALRNDGFIDARRCISYQTIEEMKTSADYGDHQGWIFGCDICQEVCPFNGTHSGQSDIAYLRSAGTGKIMKYGPEIFPEARFDEVFNESPLKRAGLNKLKENAGMR